MSDVRDAHGNFLGHSDRRVSQVAYPGIDKRAACGEEGSADSAKANGPQVASPAAAHQQRASADLTASAASKQTACIRHAPESGVSQTEAHQPQGETPRVDREEYTVKECDVGFKVVGTRFARELERELADAQANIEIEQRNRDAFRDAFVDWKGRATSAQAELAAKTEQWEAHQIETAKAWSKKVEELADLKLNIERTMVMTAKLTTELATSTNYVANTETAPTWIAFANKRTVQIVNGALEVGWKRSYVEPEDAFSTEALWKFKTSVEALRAPLPKVESRVFHVTIGQHGMNPKEVEVVPADYARALAAQLREATARKASMQSAISALDCNLQAEQVARHVEWKRAEAAEQRIQDTTEYGVMAAKFMALEQRLADAALAQEIAVHNEKERLYKLKDSLRDHDYYGDSGEFLIGYTAACSDYAAAIRRWQGG